MKEIITFIILFFGLLSCNNSKKRADFYLSEYVEENSIDLNKNKQIYNLGKLADSTFNDSNDLNNFFNFKIIDSSGSIKSTSLEKALIVHNKNIENARATVYPIFELKNSSNVVLTSYGKGLWGSIWAYIVVNKTNLKITNIEIDHHSETPGLGSEINKDDFENQFIETVIDLKKVNFSLYQNEKTIIDGLQRVDGLSGATYSSKGVVEMINNDLFKFKMYLR